MITVAMTMTMITTTTRTRTTKKTAATAKTTTTITITISITTEMSEFKFTVESSHNNSHQAPDIVYRSSKVSETSFLELLCCRS